jgi:hypothetical protein
MPPQAVDRALNGQYASLLPNPFMLTLPRSLWGNLKDYFAYTATFNPIAATSTTPVQTNINRDAAFVIIAAMATVTDSPADTTRLAFFPATVQIRDEGAGVNFYDQATHFSNVFGTAEAPAYWPIPKLLQPGSTITTTLQNIGANAQVVRIAYLGFKIYDKVTNE